ncbi:MAG: TIGR00159 family protein, partial [Candidatus Omnitrophica bacterium]|nr:TIGR00159 family protein [Candidatus Omnitrophota bacterium]
MMNWFNIINIWRPLVEIFILAVGIYYAFVLVRGTRGAAVVTGFMVVLLVLTILTTVLQLQVLSWLLRTFFTFFAVAVL